MNVQTPGIILTVFILSEKGHCSVFLKSQRNIFVFPWYEGKIIYICLFIWLERTLTDLHGLTAWPLG